jgi:serine/threonine protein kinase
MFSKNPIRMYNTIEDVHFMPEFSEEPKVTFTEKIGPDSFIPIQLLGKGSFGEVYLVQMKCNNKLYAMKILQKDKIFSNNLVRYATTERNVLTYFTKHPFIVNLNYAFQTSTKLFLILDYCPGGDLGQLIQREGYLSEEQAKVYMAEVLLALEDLHKSDIIFRDLKPDNVVIDSDGHALLTDFGLSKEGIFDNKSATSFCGSVAYLAPEMLKRQGHGKSVDWYLLGVLLYEMLFGKTPYFSESKEELFHNIKSGKLKISRNLSNDAIDILKCLLNRNPNKRLGAGKGGANLIKSHPFFNDIDWDL